MCNTTVATSGAGTVCPLATHEITPYFSLVFCVVFWPILFVFSSFYFYHWFVSRYPASDYPFSIFKPLFMYVFIVYRYCICLKSKFWRRGIFVFILFKNKLTYPLFMLFLIICILSIDFINYNVENTENGQFRETGHIGYTRRRKSKQKYNTICVGQYYARTNINNVNKTWAILCL